MIASQRKGKSRPKKKPQEASEVDSLTLELMNRIDKIYTKTLFMAAEKCFIVSDKKGIRLTANVFEDLWL